MHCLFHHGILGQKWGVRRYQYPDGTLTPAGRRRLDRMDSKWVKKNAKKIYKQTAKASRSEMRQFRSDKTKLSYVNEYNQTLASVMNKNVGTIQSPSGKIVRFIAKRGEIGVHMALADPGYDMNQVRNGVYGTGRVAYRKQQVERI